MAGPLAGGGEETRRLPRSLAALVRRHALFLGLLGLGAALRVVTSLAYSPALIFPDSIAYLNNAADLEPYRLRPLGYPLFLRALPLGHGLAWVPAVQHAMGLLIAVLIYALLLRLGVRRWAAALASAPLLLDAYQLNIEEYVLSETLFHLLVLGGCFAILWTRRPGILAGGLAGLLFALAAVTRANGMVVMAPALVTLLCLGAGRVGGRATPRSLAGILRRLSAGVAARRRSLGAAAGLLIAFALPVAGYAAWFHSAHGSYGFTGATGRFLYARVAPFADCSKFQVPRDERVLCPREPVGRRPTRYGSSVEYYMWTQESPINLVHPWAKRMRLPGDFAKRVILHQPLTYLRTAEHYFLRSFALTRTRKGGEPPVSRWQFPLTYPAYVRSAQAVIRAHGDGRGTADRDLARFLRSYQRFGYAPGPLLAIGLAGGLIAALGLGRARRSGLRSASFLFAATGFVVLASTVLVNQFTWRYQLTEVMLLPPAAAVGLTALLRRPRPGGAFGDP